MGTRREAAWAGSIRDQCQRGGVPFFFKQWGGVRKGKTGRDLDGQTYDGMPPIKVGQVPEADEYGHRLEQVAGLSRRFVSLPRVIPA